MEEKLRLILSKNENKIEKYNAELKRIRYALDLYKKHGFEEELRAATLRRDSIENLIADYSWMLREITELLNKWES